MDGSYRLDHISWIVWIVSDGSYQLDHLDCIGWIVLVSVLGSLGETRFRALAGLLLAEWEGCT